MALANAIKIAAWKHGESLDKGGQPFIGHPLRVMAKLAADNQPESVLEAAVLHDVLEDTGTDPRELVALGVEDFIVETVQVLTRSKDEDYFDYIRRVAEHDAATIIKLADLADNLNPNRRVKGLKLEDRYERAVEILTRRRALREVARLGQEMGGYDFTPRDPDNDDPKMWEDYAQAMKEKEDEG